MWNLEQQNIEAEMWNLELWEDLDSETLESEQQISLPGVSTLDVAKASPLNRRMFIIDCPLRFSLTLIQNDVVEFIMTVECRKV
jgi:hypothetical protein